MNVYNETERIKYIFGHIRTKDKQMKIINKGYHELYMDREKDTFFMILRRWLEGRLSVTPGEKAQTVPSKFRTDFKEKKPWIKGRILAVVVLYVVVALAWAYEVSEQQEGRWKLGAYGAAAVDPGPPDDTGGVPGDQEQNLQAVAGNRYRIQLTLDNFEDCF
jgi:hypothetical protein